MPEIRSYCYGMTNRLSCFVDKFNVRETQNLNFSSIRFYFTYFFFLDDGTSTTVRQQKELCRFPHGEKHDERVCIIIFYDLCTLKYNKLLLLAIFFKKFLRVSTKFDCFLSNECSCSCSYNTILCDLFSL